VGASVLIKKLFLASVLSVSAFCADEEPVPTEKNIWDEGGAYIKLGLQGVELVPILPSVGLGYYAKVGSKAVDFSATYGFINPVSVLNIKMLALPVITERFQFGLGFGYVYLACFSREHYLGVDLLFRKIKPNSKNFFQLEFCQSFLSLGYSSRLEYHPRINIMFGHRF